MRTYVLFKPACIENRDGSLPLVGHLRSVCLDTVVTVWGSRSTFWRLAMNSPSVYGHYHDWRAHKKVRRLRCQTSELRQKFLDMTMLVPVNEAVFAAVGLTRGPSVHNALTNEVQEELWTLDLNSRQASYLNCWDIDVSLTWFSMTSTLETKLWCFSRYVDGHWGCFP